MAIVNKGALLEEITKQLDISPSMYKIAVERYETIANYLQKKGVEADFYPQGSFRLGTVTRPVKNGKDSEYDIDLVCHMAKDKDETTPSVVKNTVGTALKMDACYRDLLDDEGRRCWTLIYAEIQDTGFHIDILPSVSEEQGNIQLLTGYGVRSELAQSAIAITNKNEQTYSWASGNPRGYAEWFDEINKPMFDTVVKEAREAIFRSNTSIFASIDDVPLQLVRTPLQRVVQILKRHRDVRFVGHELEADKPISMIITTLSAQIVRNWQCSTSDTFALLRFVVTRLTEYADLIGNNASKIVGDTKALIRRDFSANRWTISNPVNPLENFADRWHENDNRKAKAFFLWVKWVQTDLIDVLSRPDFTDEALTLFFGDSIIKKASAGYNARFSQRITPSPANATAPAITITSPGKPWGV